jgi:hypothetical protein
MSAPHEEVTVIVKDGYYPLFDMLMKALDQSQNGKGNERHNVNPKPFVDQPIMSIPRLLNHDSGVFFQAIKKIQEAQNLSPDRAEREYLGAIVYIAAGILLLKEKS